MDLRAAAGSAIHHRMRTYYIALVAGGVLMTSAFLPWVLVGDTAIGGVPDLAGMWVLGLGLAAVVLASLSIYTRKNSRHPLLVVGLTSLGILFLAWQWLERSARQHAWARAQALAIVDDVAAPPLPATSVGLGIYLGLAAALVLMLFGLTIVFKQAATPYAKPEDDDV